MQLENLAVVFRKEKNTSVPQEHILGVTPPDAVEDETAEQQTGMPPFSASTSAMRSKLTGMNSDQTMIEKEGARLGYLQLREIRVPHVQHQDSLFGDDRAR